MEFLIGGYRLIPSLRESVRITVPSASGRVKRHGKALGAGAHTWFQAKDGEQVERAREIVKLRAMELGCAWQKPFIHDVGTNTTHWLNDDDSIKIGLACFSDDAPTMEELVKSFEQIDDATLRQEYADLVARLTSAEREEIFTYIGRRLGITKRVFNAALKEADAARRREALQREIGSRKVIAYAPDQITVMSRTVESIIDERIPIERYHVFGGRPSQIVAAADMEALVAPCGATTSTRYVLKPLDEVAVRGVVEEVAVFQLAKGNDPKNICVPEKVIDTLLRSSEHAVRPIRGLLTHPIVLGDGAILAAPGYDQTTGLYLCGERLDNVSPYTQPQARQALKRIKQCFLADMKFKSDLDADVAVAALLTGVQRRVLDQAPGIAILAPIQASGKTTLARRIHITLTGYDMPVTSFPLNNEMEIQKSLLAALSKGPEMICLDNITDGITFSSASLSSAITSMAFTQRKLGVSEEISCLTNTLFVMTGNNISFGADEVSRWLTITLDPQTARPQERRFQHPDVVRHALGFRPDVLRDCVGILAGFGVHGQTTAPTTRFARWDEMVRQPLMWAGGRDPTESFRNNEEKSEIGGASVALLVNLKKLFGNRRFRAVDLVATFTYGVANAPHEYSAIAEAMARLHTRQLTNPSSVGRALASVKDRHIVTDDGKLVLRGCLNCGNQEYWVETCKS